LRHQDLAGGSRGLRPRRGVHDGSDRGQIMMRSAEFAEADFSGIDPDSDADRPFVGAERLDERLSLGRRCATRASW
jgi:hypothetical protein